MNLTSRQTNLIAVILLVVMFILAIGSMRNDAGIVDEVAHIPAGYSYLKFQDYRLNPEHPPLIKILSAVPLVFMDLKFPLNHLAWATEANGQWESGWQFIYHIGNDADKILFASRIPEILLMLLLGFFIYKWTSEIAGRKTALLALFFYSFSPTVIAHSRFVTTDLGVTVFLFISLYYFVRFIKTPNGKNLFIAGITLGLAQLAKFSAILLLPSYSLLIASAIIILRLKKPKINFSICRYLGSFFLIIIIAYLLVGIFYQGVMLNYPSEKQHQLIDASFSSQEIKELELKNKLHWLSNNKLTRPYGQYFTGLFMVFSHVSGGHTTFLLGDFSNQGWWYYFPVAWLIKTPLAMQILIIIAITSGLKKLWRSKFLSCSFREEKKIFPSCHLIKEKIYRVSSYLWNHLAEFAMAMIILTFVLAGIKSKLNIGIRYMLPILPFVYILTSTQIVQILKSLRQRGKLKKSLVFTFYSLLLVWYLGANLYIYPSYLAYFNESIGGAKNGYLFLTDSNLDWGQDLKRLAVWAEDNNIEKIKVDYFGGGVPEYYMGDRFVEWHSEYGETKGWLAVSATFFQMSKYHSRIENKPSYQYLEKLKPVTIIGHSIFVYNIK